MVTVRTNTTRTTRTIAALLLLLSSCTTVLSFTIPTFVHRSSLSARPLHSTTLEQTSDSSGVEEVTPEVEIPSEDKEDAPAAVAEEAAAVDADDAVVVVEEEEAPAPKKKVQRVRHTVFVGNLPFDITEDTLAELFTQHATVELINLPKDRTTMIPRGFAFVDVSSEEEVDQVVEHLHGTMVGEREMRVARSIPQSEKQNKPRPPRPNGKKIYVGNIPFGATQEDISALFDAYGDISDVYIPVNRDTGLGRGFGFVTIMQEDGALKAIEEMDGVEFDGRRLVVNEPLPPGQKPPPRRKPAGNTKIYVGNLSFYTVPDTLLDLFGEFGQVYDCYFPTDRATGATRGFAFVSMDEGDANNAIAELDGCEVDDRVLRVNLAQQKPQYVEVADDEADEDGEE